MTGVELVVDALAVYRLTRLVTSDILSEGLRRRLGRPWVVVAAEGVTASSGRPRRGARYQAWVLVGCPWCVSVWIAAVVVALADTMPGVWVYPATVLAFSAVAGVLAERV